MVGHETVLRDFPQFGHQLRVVPLEVAVSQLAHKLDWLLLVEGLDKLLDDGLALGLLELVLEGEEEEDGLGGVLADELRQALGQLAADVAASLLELVEQVLELAVVGLMLAPLQQGLIVVSRVVADLRNS
jgi:hypothetical protein